MIRDTKTHKILRTGNLVSLVDPGLRMRGHLGSVRLLWFQPVPLIISEPEGCFLKEVGRLKPSVLFLASMPLIQRSNRTSLLIS
jgi:hypothetical protein